MITTEQSQYHGPARPGSRFKFRRAVTVVQGRAAVRVRASESQARSRLSQRLVPWHWHWHAAAAYRRRHVVVYAQVTTNFKL